MRNLKIRAGLALLSAIVCSCPAAGARQGVPADLITASSIRSHIYFLASEALEGRYVGSRGYETAAQFGESQFRAAGLIPVVRNQDGPTYRQDVPVLRRSLTGDLSLKVKTPYGEQVFVEGQDFKWFEGEMLPWEQKPLGVVFAGYGISEPEAGWDDLKDIEVGNKVALVMLGAPMRDGVPVLPEDLHALYAPPSAIFRKMMTLLLRGAAGIFVIPDEMIMEAWDTIPSKTLASQIEYDNADESARHVCFLALMSPDVAHAMFRGRESAPPGTGESGSETTAGFPLEGVSVEISGTFTGESVKTWNVAGVVTGSDPVLRNEYVAVTAHLDGQPPNKPGEVNCGADDNASGCAGLIDIAAAVASDPPLRSVLFVLFTGEEEACTGSRHFIYDCPVPLHSIVANLNMDMIGRSETPDGTDRTHYVLDSSKITPRLTELIKDVNKRTVNWPLKYENPIGNSDNLMFHAAGIPGALFYSGHHGDANRPSDTPDKIDFEKAESIARLVYEITVEIGNRRVPW
jgi:hypothetical protein